MDDKFRLSDIGRPLYEHSQVITEEELVAFEMALTQQYRDYPRYRFIMRWGTGVAIGVVLGLRMWLLEGKNSIKKPGEIN
jgi:hypothetical protein